MAGKFVSVLTGIFDVVLILSMVTLLFLVVAARAVYEKITVKRDGEK